MRYLKARGCFYFPRRNVWFFGCRSGSYSLYSVLDVAPFRRFDETSGCMIYGEKIGAASQFTIALYLVIFSAYQRSTLHVW